MTSTRICSSLKGYCKFQHPVRCCKTSFFRSYRRIGSPVHEARWAKMKLLGFYNQWSLLVSDSDQVFPEPNVFRLERFIDTDHGNQLRNSTFPVFPFGCGRCLSPGLSLKIRWPSSLTCQVGWQFYYLNKRLILVIILWAFNVLLPTDSSTSKLNLLSPADFIEVWSFVFDHLSIPCRWGMIACGL